MRLQLFLEITNWVGEKTFSEVCVDLLTGSAWSFNQIAWNIKQSPNLKKEVDQAERSDSQSFNKCSNWNSIDKDENPKEHGGEPYIMHEFCQKHERAGSIAKTKAYHLNEDQNDSEDVQRGDKDFDESYQQKWNCDYSLPFCHEGSSTVFLVKLSCKYSHNNLH